MFKNLAFIFGVTVTLFQPIHKTAEAETLSKSALSDSENIQKMAGCFDVTFQFKETRVTDPNYPIRSKDYLAHALEWVTVDYASENFIALQHILITPDGIQKHWRQEWEFQPLTQLNYVGPLHWSKVTLDPTSTQGQWIQKVTQVDDSPRYECVAPWGDSQWSCRTHSPLPRREFTQRNDYQILNRGNTHLITPQGWLHIENNQKLKLDQGNWVLIAEEEGVNTYQKTDPTRCLAAETWWKKNAEVWHEIQGMWRHIRGHHSELKFIPSVNSQTLWMRLFSLADAFAAETTLDAARLQKEAHDVIHEFMVE